MEVEKNIVHDLIYVYYIAILVQPFWPVTWVMDFTIQVEGLIGIITMHLCFSQMYIRAEKNIFLKNGCTLNI